MRNEATNGRLLVIVVGDMLLSLKLLLSTASLQLTFVAHTLPRGLNAVAMAVTITQCSTTSTLGGGKEGEEDKKHVNIVHVVQVKPIRMEEFLKGIEGFYAETRKEGTKEGILSEGSGRMFVGVGFDRDNGNLR